MKETTSKLDNLAIESSTTTTGKPAKSYDRRDHLLQIEQMIKAEWETAQLSESNVIENQPKYFVNFPFPYMNGFLHIGHAYSLTKTEFASRYHCLKGENVLFPFGLHCTGMPIQSAANKLKREIKMYGNPVQLAQARVEEKEQEIEINDTTIANSANKIQDKSKGKKTKLMAKTGGGSKTQWEIMKLMISDEKEICKFQNPLYWLEYFPPHAIHDLQRFGVNVDWRRTFITTDKNPYYDQFIKWQFSHLRHRIHRGKRPNIFSILDQQICADHDRSSGEGVGPQEYTLIKLQLQKPYPKVLSQYENKSIYMVAATLRPETMYGQTNCFVLPDGEYGAFEIMYQGSNTKTNMSNESEIFIMSERAAKNLAHQDYYMETWGKETCLCKISGWDLLGLPLKVPNAVYDVVYSLPLLTVSMSKGTGIVTSVPSDAPDDYAALNDLKEKKAFREKYHIEDHMVLPYDVVPIMDIPGYGNQIAVTLCKELKVASQNDKEKLAKAKEISYLKGFYEGIMIIGSAKGKKVIDAKNIIRDELIGKNEALIYYEPESLVMSRSGDECVVATLDQWYLMYGADDWKSMVMEHVKDPKKFSTFGNQQALNEYVHTLEWLRDWAPCRQYGLGTKLPWDEQFVIESLSDSTIYMAYYTIAHHLQGSWDGSVPGHMGISPEDLSIEVFDYIFLDGLLPQSTKISKANLDTMKKEFNYWYPMDLRCSGKDLIRNHLTMCLYTHAEIWKNQPEKWPRAFFANGHVLVDAEKMSKSKGNFLSLQYCCEEYGADCTRFAAADAGDTMEDANFSRETSNTAILKLTTEEEWIKKTLEDMKQEGLFREENSSLNINDEIFMHQMYLQITKTRDHFDNMQFREGLHSGFYEYQLLRDAYRDICTRSNVAMHSDVIKYFIRTQLIMLSPICPFWCDFVWRKILGESSYMIRERWPEVPKVDYKLIRAGDFLSKAIKSFREAALKHKNVLDSKKKAGQFNAEEDSNNKNERIAHIYVVSKFLSWQEMILKYMRTQYNDKESAFPSTFMKDLKSFIMTDPVAAEYKKQMKLLMQYASYVKSESEIREADAMELVMPYNQVEILEYNRSYIKEALCVKDVMVFVDIDSKTLAEQKGNSNKAAQAMPGKPSVYLI